MKDCNYCGKCCTWYFPVGLGDAEPEDLKRWDNRPDIMALVGPQPDHHLWVRQGEDPSEMTQCPWLRKQPGKREFMCSIYDLRPNACRQWPLSELQMIRIDCEMIE